MTDKFNPGSAPAGGRCRPLRAQLRTLRDRLDDAAQRRLFDELYAQQ